MCRKQCQCHDCAGPKGDSGADKVVKFKVGGKRGVRIDNFVILEESYDSSAEQSSGREERKAKGVGRPRHNAVPKPVAMKQNTKFAKVFKATSKRTVKRLKHNSNPGSYNSIESISENGESEGKAEEKRQPVPTPTQKVEHRNKPAQKEISKALPAVPAPIPQAVPMAYQPMYRQMMMQQPTDITACVPQPGCCYYLPANPRVFVQPSIRPVEEVAQLIQQMAQQPGTMAPQAYTTILSSSIPEAPDMTPFAYYSVPTTRAPVLPEMTQLAYQPLVCTAAPVI